MAYRQLDELAILSASSGLTDVLCRLIARGVSVNCTQEDGRTLLHLAARGGYTETGLELIRLGARKAIIAGAFGTPLHQAAVYGHVSTVTALLKVGCPVDVTCCDGCSVLHFAAGGGNAEVIRVVLSTGCDVNKAANDGRTPLHVAAVRGKTEAALQLIQRGAAKAIVAGEVGTPLHQAAVRGHVSTVKAMLKAGCPVDVVDSNGCSVLHAAARSGDTEVIRIVLSTGFDINATSCDGRSPLHVSASAGKTKAALYLISCGADNIMMPVRGTPLHVAALCGHASTVEAMLKAGCPVDVMTSTGYSVLHAAALGDNVKVIGMVLSAGCDIDTKDIAGGTPLHVAAGEGKTKAALELIRRGAKKAVVAVTCGTPLHQAVLFGHVSTVKAMLKAGCPVDVTASDGYTVLHAAVDSCNTEMIREVMSTGCDINAKDNHDKTPLHVAAVNGNTEAALELMRQGAEKAIVTDKIGTPLHVAALHGHVSTVKAMLKKGCPVDVVDSNGDIVLHAAAQGGNVEVIRAVCSTGCDINTADKNGLTPLYVAAVNGCTEAAVELIKLGAKKDIVAGEAGTPLHQAARHGHVSTVRAMLKAGCPVDIMSSQGISVLHFAVACGNAEVIREVCSTGCDINVLAAINSVTPLHRAAEDGHTEAALELIGQGAEKAVVAGRFGTPLHQAAVYGHLLTVKALLEAGCPVDVVATTSSSVLHFAAENGSVEVIREILSADGNDIIDLADNYGETPLFVTARLGHTEATLELIRHGAKKDVVAGLKGTPLHQAAGFGHVATVRAMLKEGCPVDKVASNGCSVLHAAAQYGYVEVIGELLGRGCSVHALDNANNTPLDYAASRGETETVRMLVRYGADKDADGGTFGNPVLSAAARGHWQTVQVMFEEGFPLDGVTTDGQTLLHLAAVGGKIKLLCQLKKTGCNVSRRDYYDLRPLHYAVLCAQFPCFNALIKLGADEKAEAPLLGTVLDIVRLLGYRVTGSLLRGTVFLPVRKPDEMIVDFALCLELGIKIQSPYLFSDRGGAIISVFEFILFNTMRSSIKLQTRRNLVRTPKNLRKVLSTFSKHQLVNPSKLACLAAIHGDVEVLECLSEILTATEPQYFTDRLKQLFPAQFRQHTSNILQILPVSKLNPLQLAVIAMWCRGGLHHICMDHSSNKYTEVINFLTTNDPFCHSLNEWLPNGLSPLDLAEELGLGEAVTIISRAGGRNGSRFLIPEEIRWQHRQSVLNHQVLMQLKSGPFGPQAVQEWVGQLSVGRATTAEQGTATEESYIRQQKIFDQRPDLSVISTYVIGLVNVERWRRLGISLRIPLEALTHISSTHSSCEDRYLEVLIYWLEHDKAASWGTLLEILGHFETKLRMDLLTQKICGIGNSSWQSTSVRRSVPFHLYPPEVGATPTPLPLSSQLSPQFVSHVVRHVGVKWYNFALHLGVNSTVLDVIKVEKHLISDCCRESLYRWLRLDRDTGGKKKEEGVVLEAVRKACGPVAVERIQSSVQSSEATPSSPTPLLQSTPELAALQEHVVPFTAAQWEEVADYLRVSYEKRAAIAASEQGRVEVCCRELFNQWLQQLPGTGSLPRTWGAVLDVVGEAVGPEVAKRIRTRLDSKEGATPTPSPSVDPLGDEGCHSY